MEYLLSGFGIVLLIALTHRNAYRQGQGHERNRVIRLASEEIMGWEKALDDKPEVNMETEMYWTGARYGVLRLLDKMDKDGAPHA